MNPSISTTITQNPMKVHKAESSDLDKKEAELREGLLKLEQQKREQIIALKNQEAAKLVQQKQKREELLEDAKNYEELSLRALNSEDKVFYVQEARVARKQAAEIHLPDDDDVAVDTKLQYNERPGFFENILSHVGTVYSALFIFLGVAFLSHYMVFKIGDEINTLNKLANDAGNLSQMIPPSIGLMSFQKGWFTWMTIGIDLIALILIMAIIAPDKLFFLLPFTKKPVRSWQAFAKQEEQQKQWQSFAYVALILLFLAICQLGGK